MAINLDCNVPEDAELVIRGKRGRRKKEWGAANVAKGATPKEGTGVAHDPEPPKAAQPSREEIRTALEECDLDHDKEVEKQKEPLDTWLAYRHVA